MQQNIQVSSSTVMVDQQFEEILALQLSYVSYTVSMLIASYLNKRYALLYHEH